MKAGALLLAALLAAPAALALPVGATHEYTLATTTSSVFAEFRYHDGLASTKFAFVQLGGATGGPGERLKPTPECTEWIGTFTQVALRARATDNAASGTVRIEQPAARAPLTAPSVYHDIGMDIQIVGGLGGLRGSVLICDSVSGGLARLLLDPVEVLAPRAVPAQVHVDVEGPLPHVPTQTSSPLAALDEAARVLGVPALPLPGIQAMSLRDEVLAHYAIVGAQPTPLGVAQLDAAVAGLPPEMAASVARILAAMNEAALLRADAFARLTPDDARFLHDAGLSGASFDMARAAELLGRIDVGKMSLASRLVTDTVARETPLLRDLAQAAPGAAFVDPLGRIEVADAGAHVHAEDRTLLVDLGGDDWWANNAGSVKPDFIIDAFPGCITTGGLDCTPASGKRNGDASQQFFGRRCEAWGDNAAFHAFSLQDTGRAFVQGQLAQPSVPDARNFATQTLAAHANGYAPALDLDAGCLPQGADDVDAWSQAFWNEGTLRKGDEHGVAVGIDLDGNDRFAPPLEFNDINDGDNAAGCDGRPLGEAGKTWARNVTAGGAFAGVGVLWDAGDGDDFYGGRSIALGSGHVAGVGVLVDEGGDNTYSSVRLAQATGFFLGVGVLWSGAGDDRYRLENDSPFFNEFEHFIGCDVSTRDGQGRGNFNGVGILVDEGGDDDYFVQQHAPHIPGAARDDATTTQGSGGTRLQIVGAPFDRVFGGAVGMLWDRAGTDTYSRPGRANDVTDVSLGIFVDHEVHAPNALRAVADAGDLACWLTWPTQPHNQFCRTWHGDPANIGTNGLCRSGPSLLQLRDEMELVPWPGGFGPAFGCDPSLSVWLHRKANETEG